MTEQTPSTLRVNVDEVKNVATISTVGGFCAAAVACPLDEQGQRGFYLVNAILSHGQLVAALQDIADLGSIHEPNDDELDYIMGAIRSVMPLLGAVQDSSRVFGAVTSPSAEPSA